MFKSLGISLSLTHELLMLISLIVSIVMSVLIIDKVHVKLAVQRNVLREFIGNWRVYISIFGFGISAFLCYSYFLDHMMESFWFWYCAWIFFILFGVVTLLTHSKKKRQKRKNIGPRSDINDWVV